MHRMSRCMHTIEVCNSQMHYSTYAGGQGTRARVQAVQSAWTWKASSEQMTECERRMRGRALASADRHSLILRCMCSTLRRLGLHPTPCASWRARRLLWGSVSFRVRGSSNAPRGEYPECAAALSTELLLRGARGGLPVGVRSREALAAEAVEIIEISICVSHTTTTAMQLAPGGGRRLH